MACPIALGLCPALAQLCLTWLCVSGSGSREIGKCSGILWDERGDGERSERRWEVDLLIIVFGRAAVPFLAS